MISVQRIQGIETEYALLDAADPGADPDELATQLLYTYAQEVAAQTAAVSHHVPARDSRELLPGAGTRFDYSGETPGADARGFTHDQLPEEARTNQVHGAALTATPTKWVIRLKPFEAHYYRGSASHGPNGARLYVDHTHPEYAAPEALGPRAAARYDLAGDGLMQRAVSALNQQTGRRCVVVKNNTDGKGQAWGAHESYLMERSTPWEAIRAALIPFLATRQIIGGSGRVGLGQAREEAGFQIFQRADFVEAIESVYTTRERPIINTRDEAHAQSARWRRLHVITADSSVVPATILLRLGSTSAVLSLLENHPEQAAALAEEFRFTDPVAAVHTFSRDLTLQAHAPLASGGSATALQVQRAFLAACQRAGADDDETAASLALWEEALTALEAGIDQAAPLIEWCAKYQLLDRLRSKYGCDWDDPRIAAADLQFSMIDPRASFAQALLRSGAIRPGFTAEEVAAAEFAAPADTRAGGRAALIAAYPEQIWAAGWTSVVVDIDRKHLLRVALTDPYHPTAAEVKAAIAAARATQGATAGATAGEDMPPLERVLEQLGVTIPADPRTVSWDEGIYADGANGLNK